MNALVLVVVAVAGEVDVVDPDVRRGLDADGVARRGENLGDLEVAQDDVGLVQDAHADTLEGCGGTLLSGGINVKW